MQLSNGGVADAVHNNSYECNEATVVLQGLYKIVVTSAMKEISCTQGIGNGCH